MGRRHLSDPADPEKSIEPTDPAAAALAEEPLLGDAALATHETEAVDELVPLAARAEEVRDDDYIINGSGSHGKRGRKSPESDARDVLNSTPFNTLQHPSRSIPRAGALNMLKMGGSLAREAECLAECVDVAAPAGACMACATRRG